MKDLPSAAQFQSPVLQLPDEPALGGDDAPVPTGAAADDAELAGTLATGAVGCAAAGVLAWSVGEEAAPLADTVAKPPPTLWAIELGRTRPVGEGCGTMVLALGKGPAPVGDAAPDGALEAAPVGLDPDPTRPGLQAPSVKTVSSALNPEPFSTESPDARLGYDTSKFSFVVQPLPMLATNIAGKFEVCLFE